MTLKHNVWLDNHHGGLFMRTRSGTYAVWKTSDGRYSAHYQGSPIKPGVTYKRKLKAKKIAELAMKDKKHGPYSMAV